MKGKSAGGFLKLLFYEVVAIQVVGGRKRKKRSRSHYHRPQHHIVNVEIVMGEATPLFAENTVIGIRGRIFRDCTTESLTLFHTLEYKVYPVPVVSLHLVEQRQCVIFFSHPFFCPLKRNGMVAGIGFYPSLIFLGPLG